jgi:hypothetical protein
MKNRNLFINGVNIQVPSKAALHTDSDMNSLTVKVVSIAVLFIKDADRRSLLLESTCLLFIRLADAFTGQ